MWLLNLLLFNSVLAFAGEPVVLVIIIDGLHRDATEAVAAKGAENMKFLRDNWDNRDLLKKYLCR